MKSRHYNCRSHQKREDLRSGSVGWISFSVIAPIRKRSIGWKAGKDLLSIRMKLYVKPYVNVCKNVSIIPEQTDRHFLKYVLDGGLSHRAMSMNQNFWWLVKWSQDLNPQACLRFFCILLFMEVVHHFSGDNLYMWLFLVPLPLWEPLCIFEGWRGVCCIFRCPNNSMPASCQDF